MNREQIIAMARALGAWSEPITADKLGIIVNHAIGEEREACAKVCEQTYESRRATGNTNGFNAIMTCADSIRQRGKP